MECVLPIADKGLKIGLLGGSFNPAHMGHVHVSDEAIRLLGLDIVIWLVSPQNPLKRADIRNSLDQRVEYAKNIASNHKIIVSDLERHLPTNYTRDTIKFLCDKYPANQFIWLMGADNMEQIHHWHCWQEIFDMVFVAVFDREDYAQKSIHSEAAKVYNRFLITSTPLFDLKNYLWCFFCIKKYDISSTAIRNFIRTAKIEYERIHN